MSERKPNLTLSTSTPRIDVSRLSTDAPQLLYWQQLLSPQKYNQMTSKLNKISANDGAVLITGESGSGKSTLAQYIHDNSDRRMQPFFRWGCGELASSLVEATLFGHTDQAFTGAKKHTQGVLELADKGTLVLDDIDYLPKTEQARLLRFLDTQQFQRLGDPSEARSVDVRIIATTNKNLLELSQINQFLPDLMFRIRKWWLNLPSLRQSSKGIHSLAKLMLVETGCSSHELSFDQGAINLLQYIEWRGNFREMRDVVWALATYCDISETVTAALLLMVLRDHVYGGIESLKFSGMSVRDSVPIIYRLTGKDVALTASIANCSRQTVYTYTRH